MKKQAISSRFIILVTLLVAIFVLIRQLPSDRFKQGAENYANPALTGSNSISQEDLNALKSGSLLIFGNVGAPSNSSNLEKLLLNPKEIGTTRILETIRKSTSPRIIVAEDTGLESRIWMIMAQKGIKDLYIFQEDGGEMVFKHEFRPDTLSASI